MDVRVQLERAFGDFPRNETYSISQIPEMYPVDMDMMHRTSDHFHYNPNPVASYCYSYTSADLNGSHSYLTTDHDGVMQMVLDTETCTSIKSEPLADGYPDGLHVSHSDMVYHTLGHAVCQDNRASEPPHQGGEVTHDAIQSVKDEILQTAKAFGIINSLGADNGDATWPNSSSENQTAGTETADPLALKTGLPVYPGEKTELVRIENTAETIAYLTGLFLDSYSPHTETTGVASESGKQKNMPKKRSARKKSKCLDSEYTKDKQHKCEWCPAAFSVPSKLKLHMRIHTGEKPYACSQCASAFKRTCHLKRHIKTHSRERKPKVDPAVRRAMNNRKTFFCTLCPVAFVRPSHLELHMRTHTGEKPHKCSLCSAAFARQSVLKRHMRSHTGDKPHVCSECPQAFTQMSDLKRHIRVHSGEKPYKCGECPASYSQKHDLTVHERIHTGEKPYKCSECPAAFAYKLSLRIHTKVHLRRKACTAP